MSVKVMSLVWERYPRGGSEMLVALALADWCNDKGASLHPSIRAVAEKARLSKVQARRIIQKMITDGLLEVVGNEFGGAPGASRQYRFRIDLLPVREVETTIASESRTPADDDAGDQDFSNETALMGDTPTTLIGESRSDGISDETALASDTRRALADESPTTLVGESPPDETALMGERGTALTGDHDGSHGRSRRLSPVSETALMGESLTTIEPSVNVIEPPINTSARKIAAPKNEAPKNLKRPLPENFSISENVRKWAAQKGHRQLEAHFENFVGVARANGYVYVDWDAAFMNAVRGNWAKLENARPKSGGLAF